MKHTKTGVALLLAAAMSLGLFVPAAAETPIVPISAPIVPTTEPIIEAYQKLTFATKGAEVLLPQEVMVEHGEGFSLVPNATMPKGITASYEWQTMDINQQDPDQMMKTIAKTKTFATAPGKPGYPTKPSMLGIDVLPARPYYPNFEIYSLQVTLSQKDKKGKLVEVESSEASVLVIVGPEREPDFFEEFVIAGDVVGVFVSTIINTTVYSIVAFFEDPIGYFFG